jgi:ribosomal protein S18 acetylase RimI-like enzyme
MDESENFIHNKYGYCYYSIEDDTAYIYNLYVVPEYRRNGHAGHLLGLVITEIRSSGYSGEIQIEAQPREDSIDVENLVAFYKRMGLKIRL